MSLPQNDSRFLSRDECSALAKRAASFATGGGTTDIGIDSQWTANIQWTRNQIASSGDTRDTTVSIRRTIRGASSTIILNSFDDASLRAAIREVEQLLLMTNEQRGASSNVMIPENYTQPKIWSDATYNLSATDRANIVRDSVKPIAAANLSAFGYLSVSAQGRSVMNNAGQSLYYPYTQAQYSITVRDANNTASGWAGVDFNDWNRIDANKLAAIALQKCQLAHNPSPIEPGYYTTILEPQAVCDIFEVVMSSLDRPEAEGDPGEGPFAMGNGRSKIGQQLLDQRITVTADPMDPDLGFPPFDGGGNVYHPAVWFERGVLKNLAYNRHYGIERLGKSTGLPNSGAFRMSGGPTTIDEMIATTGRGLLVTHFSNIEITDPNSLLLTGYTRDGMMLIENGRLSKSVMNLQFGDSPFFIFNNVEQIGKPVRVFHPSAPVVVPPIKVHDFNFVSLTNSI